MIDSIVCPVENCGFYFRTTRGYRNHFRAFHQRSESRRAPEKPQELRPLMDLLIVTKDWLNDGNIEEISDESPS